MEQSLKVLARRVTNEDAEKASESLNALVYF